MTPTLVSQRSTLNPVSSAVTPAGSALRLVLDPALDRRAVVDGAWWPGSSDASAELAGLITAVDERLGRTTLRVGVHRDAWEHIPRRIPAQGRNVRVGWFRHGDPHVITLIPTTGEPVVLLIVPPGTAAGAAEATLRLAAQDLAGLTTDDILTLASLPPDPAARAATAGSPGPVTGQEATSSIRPPSARA
ncbi:DUF5994 family protein [Nonomuraea zeae]|uniref:Uncharacterized protein n=1 Tax=Nonomuraea zeae TaxID=1642303 RepID=A0A5S4GGJ8_9ACTN|nr:DUF5994 family protein [Nonomuraea zeae]TMR32085.1 hypothetical protein ETD85_23865 [Nonomuraea zeae]